MSHAVAMMMLNGRLDDDVIVPYLDALPASGYGGVCLHPRDGLAVPYGSAQFWSAIERIVGHARDRGLDVWFYDEFSFPSGADGGRIVAQYAGARARQLSFRRIVAPQVDALGNIELGPEPLLALLRVRRGWLVQDVTDRCGTHRNRWVAAEMFETDYLCTINVRQVPHERAVSTATVFVYQPETPLADDEELIAVTVVPVPARHGEAGLPDVALPEVTDRFLDEVYARYGRYARDFDLGSAPIFQDEVAYQTDHPWNELISQQLQELWGAEWRCRLLALFEPVGDGWEAARYEYWKVCAGLLERNWFARVSQYCAEHGLRMTGHLPGEESFLGHWRLLGDAFRTLGHFDLPGYDVINSPTMDDVHRSQAKGIKLVQSARWLDGRGPLVAEVFGATGFQHDAQQARTILAWLGLHDIHQPIDHSTWTSAASLRKYDAPPVNTRFNPLDVGRADLFEWHEWFRGLTREYAFDAQVLVLLPQESFARYRLEERELWAGEISLLETFFHYLEAASVDVVMIPSERLDDIEPGAEGLTLGGHAFSALVVPPVASLHRSVYAALDRLAPTGTLLWATAADEITVFDSTTSEERWSTPSTVTPATVRPSTVRPAKGVPCTEADLLRDRAGWFHHRLPLRTEVAVTDRTIIKSVRRTANGDRLLVLANPYDDAQTVRFADLPGELRPQPFTGRLTFEPTAAGWHLHLPGRAVAAIALAQEGEGSAVEAAVLEPVGLVTYELLGFNCLRLEDGTVELNGYEKRSFEPGPVSLLWDLSEVRYRDEGVLNLAPHSADHLTRQFTAEFSVDISAALTARNGRPPLRIILDKESAPPGATVLWDNRELEPRHEAVFDPDNTTYAPPPTALSAGMHNLTITGTITRGDDGLLEAPVLVGEFAVETPTDRPTPSVQLAPSARSAARARLAPLPDGPVEWKIGTPWREFGIPHGYGPVEYSFTFRVPDDQAGDGWRIDLPDYTGVAELALDGVPLGRRSWAPHDLDLDHLGAGEHRLTIVLHGSWNNVFSRLNQVRNGLLGPVRLILSARSYRRIPSR
ncbi:hypothetical protein GCM10009804_17140 [Kribbella hippodromi]|uniref:Uncharacterized protein n=1 Tax=Kribbella hippodromi TaxID=434347 RepID=A0ABN2CN66_9ACTN